MSMMTGRLRHRGIAALVLIVTMSAVAGCDRRSSAAAEAAQASPGGWDPSGRQACAEFDAGWRRATDTPARLRLADTVERLARRSDNTEIMPPATAMGSSADDGDRAWHAAAERLLRTCGRTGGGTAPPALPVTG